MKVTNAELNVAKLAELTLNQAWEATALVHANDVAPAVAEQLLESVGLKRGVDVEFQVYFDYELDQEGEVEYISPIKVGLNSTVWVRITKFDKTALAKLIIAALPHFAKAD